MSPCFFEDHTKAHSRTSSSQLSLLLSLSLLELSKSLDEESLPEPEAYRLNLRALLSNDFSPTSSQTAKRMRLGKNKIRRPTSDLGFPGVMLTNKSPTLDCDLGFLGVMLEMRLGKNKNATLDSLGSC